LQLEKFHITTFQLSFFLINENHAAFDNQEIGKICATFLGNFNYRKDLDRNSTRNLKWHWSTSKFSTSHLREFKNIQNDLTAVGAVKKSAEVENLHVKFLF
jgi:hypothetical protein